MISLCSLRILLLIPSKSSIMISEFIQDFGFEKQVTFAGLRLSLKFLLFQITIGFSFSPFALTKKATVVRSLDFLPPLHLRPSSAKLLSGSARKKHPGRFPFDQKFRFEIPGIPCGEWNSIFRLVVPGHHVLGFARKYKINQSKTNGGLVASFSCFGVVRRL